MPESEYDYFCPFCGDNCGPDYSRYSDHVYDQHPDSARVRQSWA